MSKGNQPTSEELKFIYKFLDEGYSDADILSKYDELKRHGKLGSLPYRYDPRFPRQKRKEFEAAKKVLEGKYKRQENPAIIKALDEHFTKIKEIVTRLYKVFPSDFPLFIKQFKIYTEQFRSRQEVENVWELDWGKLPRLPHHSQLYTEYSNI